MSTKKTSTSRPIARRNRLAAAKRKRKAVMLPELKLDLGSYNPGAAVWNAASLDDARRAGLRRWQHVCPSCGEQITPRPAPHERIAAELRLFLNLLRGGKATIDKVEASLFAHIFGLCGDCAHELQRSGEFFASNAHRVST